VAVSVEDSKLGGGRRRGEERRGEERSGEETAVGNLLYSVHTPLNGIVILPN
jgi:hypothetical protein